MRKDSCTLSQIGLVQIPSFLLIVRSRVRKVVLVFLIKMNLQIHSVAMPPSKLRLTNTDSDCLARPITNSRVSSSMMY